MIVNNTEDICTYSKRVIWLLVAWKAPNSVQPESVKVLKFLYSGWDGAIAIATCVVVAGNTYTPRVTQTKGVQSRDQNTQTTCTTDVSSNKII